ncbi:MAG: fumarylacetoacetase [Phycisphaerae bacterium]|nr:fumarylacetoacetase [Phycisphaerae bacterium]
MSKQCWVPGADRADGDFPIDNLPWGVGERTDRPGVPRIVTAIGEHALDLAECAGYGLLEGVAPRIVDALRRPTLNAFMALSASEWRATRSAVTELLTNGTRSLRDHARRDDVLLPMSRLRMGMPACVGDYTDFYASVHHASNVGTMFRPTGNALLPNWKHLPVGYHGRASSLVVSGAPVVRPCGQTSATDDGPPAFGPSKLLDYELEMGFFFGGAGNALGERVPIAAAREHIFGCVLLNDWSARDVQKWEYQPLGPFNAKNFCTSISPWVVTMDALAPYCEPGPTRGADDPPLLDYLRLSDDFVVNVTLEVRIQSTGMREQGTPGTRISLGNFRDMYWTMCQMLAHHTSTGCNMRPGDLLGSGTISGPGKESRGCLLERTWRGTEPVTLDDGTERKFLQDGDEVTIAGWCEKPGLPRIGFGTCTGRVLPAK